MDCDLCIPDSCKLNFVGMVDFRISEFSIFSLGFDFWTLISGPCVSGAWNFVHAFLEFQVPDY